jgi:hypothetical protein
MDKPTDDQKIVAHLMTEARKAGREHAWISRDDLLNGKLVPVAAGMRLVFAALTMPTGLLEWSADQQQFRMSEKLEHALAARSH